PFTCPFDCGFPFDGGFGGSFGVGGAFGAGGDVIGVGGFSGSFGTGGFSGSVGTGGFAGTSSGVGGTVIVPPDAGICTNGTPPPNVCQSGKDEETGSEYVVCAADCFSAW